LQSHDTQSSAVAFTCMTLGAYPDIQVSLQQCVHHKITVLIEFSGERVERGARRKENFRHERRVEAEIFRNVY
jgi:hypothetical protein